MFASIHSSWALLQLAPSTAEMDWSTQHVHRLYPGLGQLKFLLTVRVRVSRSIGSSLTKLTDSHSALSVAQIFQSLLNPVRGRTCHAQRKLPRRCLILTNPSRVHVRSFHCLTFSCHIIRPPKEVSTSL